MHDAFRKLLKKEKLHNLDIFIQNYETFEEYPLISRYQHLTALKKHINVTAKSKLEFDIYSAIIEFSTVYITEICNHAQKHLSVTDYKNFFCCLTFFHNMDNEDRNIPHFLVSIKKQLFNCLADNQILLESDDYLFQTFMQLNIIQSFEYFVSKNDDPELNRLYCIPTIMKTNKNI